MTDQTNMSQERHLNVTELAGHLRWLRSIGYTLKVMGAFALFTAAITLNYLGYVDKVNQEEGFEFFYWVLPCGMGIFGSFLYLLGMGTEDGSELASWLIAAFGLSFLMSAVNSVGANLDTIASGDFLSLISVMFAPAVCVFFSFRFLRGALATGKINKWAKMHLGAKRRQLLNPTRIDYHDDDYDRPGGRLPRAVILLSCGISILAVAITAYAAAFGSGFDARRGVHMATGISLAVWLYYLDPKSQRRKVEDVLKTDTRLPVVFLRAFRDDDMAAPRMGLVFGQDEAARFEENVSAQFWRIGPMIAIGQPGETDGRKGAAREYVPNDEWQNRVRTRVAEAQAIALVLGNSKGVIWELKNLYDLGVCSKLVLIIPPMSEQELEHRADLNAEAIQGIYGTSRLTGLDKDSFLLCVMKQSDGEILKLFGSQRSQANYNAALLVACYMLARANADSLLVLTSEIHHRLSSGAIR